MPDSVASVKTMGDIVESVIGALFLDLGCDPLRVWEVISSTILKDVLASATPENAIHHPINVFIERVDVLKVTFTHPSDTHFTRRLFGCLDYFGRMILLKIVIYFIPGSWVQLQCGMEMCHTRGTSTILPR